MFTFLSDELNLLALDYWLGYTSTSRVIASLKMLIARDLICWRVFIEIIGVADDILTQH